MINVFKAYLSVALDAGGSETTISVDRITTLTGETVATSHFADFARGILTVNPDGDGNTSYPEWISFTAVSGLTFTGAVRGLSALSNSVVTANKRFAPVGTPVVISFGVHNIQDILDYVDDAVVGGIGTADDVTAGSTKLTEDLDTHARAMAALVHQQDTPGMTLAVEPFATTGPAGVLSFAGGNTGSMSAPTVNPRIDLIVYNVVTAGLAVRTGTEGASPSAPTPTLGDIVLAEVYHRVGETTLVDRDVSPNTQGYIRRWYQPSPPFSYLPPTGTVLDYAGATAPSGFLECDGSAVSRTTYASLFSVLSTVYGAGNGSTTFNLPDLRGRFALGRGTGTKVLTFASRSSNDITITGAANNDTNEVQTGQAVLYSAPSGAMTGLTDNTTYYIIRTSALVFKLATSRANAVAGTAIALSSDGTGAQTFTITLTARTIADTGGHERHSLVTAEIPAHTHSETIPSGGGAGTGGAVDSYAAGGTTGATGGSGDHTVMPPSLALMKIIKI